MPAGSISEYKYIIEGIVSDTFISWFVFQMTSGRVIAPIVLYFGDTLAGIDVLFQSRKMCHDVFAKETMRLFIVYLM